MITIKNDDLLTQDVDVIVNAANSFLRHGGGLARAVADAATTPKGGLARPNYALGVAQRIEAANWRKEQDDHPTIATGDVAVTSAGFLPQKAIIHAVGPIWGGGRFFERQLLRSAYARSLEVAGDNCFDSIAFPAISSGIFRVPMPVVANAALRALGKSDLDIRICLTNDDDVSIWSQVAFDLGVDITTNTR